MASKQLTAKVRLNTTQAEKSIDRLVNKINRIDNVLNKAGNGSSSQLSKNVKKTVSATQQWATALDTVNSKLNGSKSLVKSIGSGLKTLADRYLGIMGMGAVIKTSDAITSAENKLNYIHGGDTTLTQDAMDKMYTSAQKVRMSYTDMMSNVSKSMALAGDSFKGSTDMAIRFQEIMAEAYAVGGASAQEMSSSMYQLIQALGAGVLAGDELRSVREGAPLAYKQIEKFAQGVYNTEESLKDLASQGKITSEMVVAAIMNAGNEMDSAFAQTEQTFAQTWEQIKNVAKRSFLPVAKMLRKALNKAIDNGLIKKVEKLFSNIAKGVVIVFKVIENCINWIVENWGWLQHVLVGVLIAIITYETLAGAVGVASAILNAMAWWEAHAALHAVAIKMATILVGLGFIIAGVLIAIYVFIAWKTAAIDTIKFIAGLVVALGLIIIGVLVIVGVIATGGALLIALAIVAAIAIIIYWFEYTVAVIYSVGAAIWNIVLGLINGIIQLLWRSFVEPWIGIIEWVLNVFNGGFNSFGDAVKNLLGNIISWFLNLGTVVTQIIDAIFGTNWTDGLNSLKDSVLKWGKNENSITLKRESPTLQSLTGGKIDRWAYSDAWNTGLNHGNTVKNAVNNWGSKYQTGFNLDGITNSLGIDTSEFDNLFNDKTVGNDFSDLLGDTSDIAGNTDKMADSMELTNDDLEYLRKIAEMEWRNEFTTAEIKVDMTNNNTVNGERDLDGIVTYLSDVLREEMTNVAYGVHY